MHERKSIEDHATNVHAISREEQLVQDSFNGDVRLRRRSEGHAPSSGPGDDDAGPILISIVRQVGDRAAL
eukprot:1122073-Heterocapsa_arctica.AAC.1